MVRCFNLIPSRHANYRFTHEGPGSFFKSHVDTPRSDKLFATLVVVLPTVHKGGNLLLGQNGKLLNLNSAEKVYDPESKAPRIAFVSFYSDIEHQVLPVESGYRVTLTYNLHLAESIGPKSMLNILSVDSYSTLITSFASVIASPTVLPKGGALGFGLLYRYPINPKTTNLAAFTGALKGNDALVRSVCQALGLEPSVKVLYEESDMGGDEYLSDKVQDGYDLSSCDDETPSRKLWRDAGATRVLIPGDQAPSLYKTPVLWVTPPSKMVTTDLAYMTYGNEASLCYAYGDLVLIAKFPAYRERVEHLKKKFPKSIPAKILADIEKALKEFPEKDDDEDEDEEMTSEDSEDYDY